MRTYYCILRRHIVNCQGNPTQHGCEVAVRSSLKGIEHVMLAGQTIGEYWIVRAPNKASVDRRVPRSVLSL